MKHPSHLVIVLRCFLVLVACTAHAFAGGGDTDLHKVTFVSMGKEVETREVFGEGMVGGLPNVSEPGYDLIGWFDESGQQIFDDTLVEELAGTTITAEWSIIDYDIVYKDGNDTFSGLQPSSYTVKDKTVVLPSDVAKSRYIFKGWYDNIKLEGDPIEQFDGTDCEDKMFYAKFELDAYPLWVGGTQVTSANATNILGDGTAWFEGTATNGTLSLSNATITATAEHPGINTAGIWSGAGFNLTISLAGSNRVESAESTSDDFCVYARSNLAITGEGTLFAGSPGEDTGGISAYESLRIDGATVTVFAGDVGLEWGRGTLAISNATVTATGTGGHGIYCSGSSGRIDIADSVVTATGGATGLYPPGVGSSLVVSGSSVVTMVTTSDDGVAFSAGALVLGDRLAVTEPAGGVFGEDGWGSGCVIDPATGAPAKRVVIDRRFAVTVVGGSTTNTTARAGETVTIVANAPEEGHGFVQWSADDAMDLSFARADAATTTFAMPERAVTVTAVFKEIQIDSIPDQEWTGGPVEPEFRSDTVKFEGTDLVLLPGTDYTVSYTNNVDPGTATATVTMAPPRTGHASVTFRILPPPVPPAVSNVVARQRWPWNGLVDVDYEVGGSTNLLAGVTARITFEERIEGGTGRIWIASNFLAGAEPSVEPGLHRATWDTAADGVTGVVAAVKATVNLVGTGSEKGFALVSKTVIVTPVDPDSIPSCVEINGNYYLLTNDPKGVGIDFRFGSGCDSAKVGEVVGITLDPEKVKEFFGMAESLQFVPSEGVKLVDPATGDKVDSLEENADGSVTFFVTADQVVPGGSITVHGDDKTVVIDNINFYDSVPEGWVGVVVTSAASAEFRLDTREGPRESDGTETITYSSLWHGTADSTVTILENGSPLSDAQGLAGESNYVWKAFVNGTNVLTHVTMASSAEPETAIFVVSGLNADLTAEIAWKLLEATGTYFAQLKVTCTNGLSAGVSDLKFMFADRIGADGKNEAALWNTPARSANANTTTVDGEEYRFVALDPTLITEENTPVAYGVSDLSASSIPVNERTIELYVCRRVKPQAGNESAANVDNFVGYVVWSSGGENLSLPVVAGAAGRVLGAAGLATASSNAALPSPKQLNTALAVGVMPGKDGEPYCKFSEFSVDGDTIRGKIEVGADGQAGRVGENARLVLLGGDSTGGALADLCTVDVGSDGSFSVPAPKDARFFKLALEIGEVAE